MAKYSASVSTDLGFHKFLGSILAGNLHKFQSVPGSLKQGRLLRGNFTNFHVVTGRLQRGNLTNFLAIPGCELLGNFINGQEDSEAVIVWLMPESFK